MGLGRGEKREETREERYTKKRDGPLPRWGRGEEKRETKRGKG